MMSGFVAPITSEKRIKLSVCILIRTDFDQIGSLWVLPIKNDDLEIRNRLWWQGSLEIMRSSKWPISIVKWHFRIPQIPDKIKLGILSEIVQIVLIKLPR